jgi:phage-related protein
MKKRVIVYLTPSGRSPVLKFLEDLSDRVRGRVEADIDFLEHEPGIEIGEPTYKHLRGPIWEIRTPTHEGDIRVLFGVDGDDAVLVHALKKKQRRLDPKDLTLAEKRFKEYLARK